MSRRPERDPELEDLFAGDAELTHLAALLRAAELKPPPLDPTFKHELRRRVMHQAYETRDRRARPPLLRRLLGAPQLALAAGVAGVLLLAVVVFPALKEPPGGNVAVHPAFDTMRPVAVNQPVALAFDQPMDHQSVEQAVKVEPATQVSYEWRGNTLLVTPVAGTFAGNTQYHVTVAATARTTDMKPIGRPADVTFVTQPQPTPLPPPASPAPSPTPTLALTEEKLLAQSLVTLLGMAPDGGRLIGLTAAGDLVVLPADGLAGRTLESGVASAVVSADGAQAGVLLKTGTAEVVPTDGSAKHAVSARVVGFKAGKAVLAGADGALKLEDGTTGLGLSAPGAKVTLSPDGAWAVLVDAAGTATAAGTDGHPGARLASADFAFAPDSAHLAALAGTTLSVSGPDGGATRPLAVPDEGSGAFLSWLAPDTVLVAGPRGIVSVKLDGTATPIADRPVTALVAAGDGHHLGLDRGGQTYSAVVANAGGSLESGAKLVDQFESARLAGNDAGIAAVTTASAARSLPPSPAAGLHLKRYYEVTSQTGAAVGQLVFVARLVFADGAGNEKQFVDETLTIERQGDGSLKVAAVTDAAAHPLGSGPTVIGVQPAGPMVLVYFDSDLDPATVSAGISLAGPNGTALPARATYANRVVTLTLADPARPASLTLIVTSDLKDVAGTPASPYRLPVG